MNARLVAMVVLTVGATGCAWTNAPETICHGLEKSGAAGSKRERAEKTLAWLDEKLQKGSRLQQLVHGVAMPGVDPAARGAILRGGLAEQGHEGACPLVDALDESGANYYYDYWLTAVCRSDWQTLKKGSVTLPPPEAVKSKEADALRAQLAKSSPKQAIELLGAALDAEKDWWGKPLTPSTCWAIDSMTRAAAQAEP